MKKQLFMIVPLVLVGHAYGMETYENPKRQHAVIEIATTDEKEFLVKAGEVDGTPYSQEISVKGHNAGTASNDGQNELSFPPLAANMNDIVASMQLMLDSEQDAPQETAVRQGETIADMIAQDQVNPKGTATVKDSKREIEDFAINMADSLAEARADASESYPNKLTSEEKQNRIIIEETGGRSSKGGTIRNPLVTQPASRRSVTQAFNLRKKPSAQDLKARLDAIADEENLKIAESQGLGQPKEQKSEKRKSVTFKVESTDDNSGQGSQSTQISVQGDDKDVVSMTSQPSVVPQASIQASSDSESDQEYQSPVEDTKEARELREAAIAQMQDQIRGQAATPPSSDEENESQSGPEKVKIASSQSEHTNDVQPVHNAGNGAIIVASHQPVTNTSQKLNDGNVSTHNTSHDNKESVKGSSNNPTSHTDGSGTSKKGWKSQLEEVAKLSQETGDKLDNMTGRGKKPTLTGPYIHLWKWFIALGGGSAFVFYLAKNKKNLFSIVTTRLMRISEEDSAAQDEQWKKFGFTPIIAGQESQKSDPAV